MFNRFSNIIGQGGIRELIRTALTNPALLLNECMNAEKLVFVACILLPLGFLPLMTKKLSSLILICPMVIGRFSKSVSESLSSREIRPQTKNKTANGIKKPISYLSIHF